MTPQQEALQSPRRSDTANATSTPIFTIPNLKSIKKKRRGAAAFPSPHAHSTPVAIKSEPVQTASLLDRIYGSNTQAQGTTSHALPFAKGFAATSILSSIYPSPVYTQDRCKVEPESPLVLRSAASGSESICTPARKNGARPSTVFDHLATPDSASAGQNDGTGRRSVLPSRIDNLFRLVDSPLPTLAYRPVRVSTYKRKKAHKIGKKPEMLTDSSSGSESSDSFPSLFQRAKSLPCTTANTGRRLIDRIQALDMHAAADQDEEMKMRSSSPTQPEPSLWPEAYPVWLTAGPSTVKLAK
ncbi:unnamed protein product [Mycena citricolor]|uniref:Uncharacterized protein n=1 Tax=Mycena citricolor TaxID=2018698 RepID=A0AAD2HAN3_9AGAR|nr:unnamed protein product [Mycena citricolor]